MRYETTTVQGHWRQTRGGLIWVDPTTRIIGVIHEPGDPPCDCDNWKESSLPCRPLPPDVLQPPPSGRAIYLRA